MTDKEAIELLKLNEKTLRIANSGDLDEDIEAVNMGIKALENQKSLGEEMRKIREGINDENVLFGFNLAIAICNKYLGENK